jgi:hypothetical protein
VKKAILYLPTLLLVAIAVNQLILANFFSLSPWLGGGYGMFSTTDVGSNRHIHIYAKSEGIIKELIYPKELSDLALRTKSFPTDRNLNKFTRTIAQIEDDSALKSIEIQVWKSHFKTYSLDPSSKILRSVELKLN